MYRRIEREITRARKKKKKFKCDKNASLEMSRGKASQNDTDILLNFPPLF